MAELVKTIENYPGITFGCDPEFFFTTQNGQIVGAEKVLPSDGKLGYKNMYGSDSGKFVLDGVQIELNPLPTSCRANMSNEIKLAFQALKTHLKQNGTEFKANFSTVVTLDPKELESLSEKAKVFGCAPSLNSSGEESGIKVDARTYTKRAAGGHLHLGLTPVLMTHREELVPILDIIIGNTCVMIDRDPHAAERRLHYGRAGEYRLPKHGLEYRTLSNFWLRNYKLMSLVMGLARMSCSILTKSYPVSRPAKPYGYTDKNYDEIYPAAYYEKWDAAAELIDLVDLEEIKLAINNNDLKLAKKNYYEGKNNNGGVRGFIERYTVGSQSMGLSASSLKVFDFFLEKVWSDGIEYWFPEDPIEHWTNKPEGHGHGWESFLSMGDAFQKYDAVSKNIQAIGAMPEVLIAPEIIKRNYYNVRDQRGKFVKIPVPLNNGAEYWLDREADVNDADQHDFYEDELPF